MLNQFSGELYPEIIAMEQRSDNDEEFRFFLEPQQEGYYFINPTTRQMIELGDNFNASGFSIRATSDSFCLTIFYHTFVLITTKKKMKSLHCNGIGTLSQNKKICYNNCVRDEI